MLNLQIESSVTSQVRLNHIRLNFQVRARDDPREGGSGVVGGGAGRSGAEEAGLGLSMAMAKEAQDDDSMSMVLEDDPECVDKCIDLALWMKLMNSTYEQYVGDRESVVRLMIDTAAAESLKQRKRRLKTARQQKRLAKVSSWTSILPTLPNIQCWCLSTSFNFLDSLTPGDSISNSRSLLSNHTPKNRLKQEYQLYGHHHQQDGQGETLAPVWQGLQLASDTLKQHCQHEYSFKSGSSSTASSAQASH